MHHMIRRRLLCGAVLALGLTALRAPVLHAEAADGSDAMRRAPRVDFSAPDPQEALSGGAGTNRDRLEEGAFSQPSSLLGFEARSDFFVGRHLFDREWRAAGPGADAAEDGLGPRFNARSCRGCHLGSGRGPSPEETGSGMRGMLFALADGQGAPDPRFGHQLHPHATPALAAEGHVKVRYEDIPFVYPDGQVTLLRKPVYSTDAPLAKGVALNPRIAPPLIGLGLVEAIAHDDILARADPGDVDGDGISGRAHVLPDGALGRFGWKATTGSVLEQSALAFSKDMGLSTWVFPAPYGDCTKTQAACRAGPHGDDEGLPEVTDDVLDLVTHYSANLAVPGRRNPGAPEVLAGKALFHAAGCIGCHTPKAVTSQHAPEALSAQVIWPYSDFLVHDMGPGLADPTPVAGSAPREWRTQPLWGVGLTQTEGGRAVLLHDGRARSLEEAILWHGGEAEAARDAFAGFTADDRARLIAFLQSL